MNFTATQLGRRIAFALLLAISACAQLYPAGITAAAGGQTTTGTASVGPADPILPKLRYAAIRLAPGHPDEAKLIALTVTNNGRVLLATDKSALGDTVGYRWYQGRLSTLVAPTNSWLPSSPVNPDDDSEHVNVISMNESGTVIGAQDVYCNYRPLAFGLYWPADQTNAQTMAMTLSPSRDWYLKIEGLYARPSHILTNGTVYGEGGSLYANLTPPIVNFDDGVVWSNPAAIPSRLGHDTDSGRYLESRYVESTSPQGQLLYYIYKSDFTEDYEAAGKTFPSTLNSFTPMVINDSARFVGQSQADGLAYWGSATEELTLLGSVYPQAINTANDILAREGGPSKHSLWLWRPDSTSTAPTPAYHYVKYGINTLVPAHHRLDVKGHLTDQRLLIGQLLRTEDDQGAALPSEQTTAPVLLVPAELAVDANRDGTITLATDGGDPALIDTTSLTKPLRFWSNDDDDDGDISSTSPTLVGNPDEPGRLSGFWELDGRTPDHAHPGVDGRSDLLDFFPVYLDIKQLLTVLPHTATGITYKLKQADSGLNFVYTNLTRTEAFDYLKYNKERVAYGLPSDQKKAHEALTVAITAAGAPLDADFLARIKNEADKGVILVEGKLATDKPLRLVVEKDGVEVAEVSLNIKISEVEKMYRWINVRAAGGQSVTRRTDLTEPANYPDRATNGKMFIFVHGYNVNERQSRAWNAEAFKRMYQSGSHAMFTAVSWNGDFSQLPYVGVAFDYWENITRAFKTAQALAPVVNGLPGSSRVIAGHSMGNVVVSSAIKDYGLNATKYLMVDAAVAREAYDTSSAALSVDAMRHPDWPTYERRLWSTNWYNLFPTGDGRRGLTWMNRFGNLSNAVNIYSSGEEVLNNNDLVPGEIPPIGPERVWIIQEMAKGTTHLAALLTFDIQGGWGFNGEWMIAETTTTGGPHGGTTTTYRNRTPAEAAALTDDQLRTEPFFGRFQNAAFTSPTGGSAAAADPVARANALGGAIPALSFPAGRNPVPLFSATRNRDLMAVQDGWPQERLNDNDAQNRWFHSDIKNIAYVFNRGAWELFVTEGNLK